MSQRYEQIVDDIRTVLLSDVDPTEEAMRDLDERYADSVNEVNQRLRKCSELLDKGLRSESIQKCEAEPNLLEVVGILDLPEYEQFADFTKQFGLPGPPRISSEIAAHLNDAYIEEASLADLLRQHRLHALLRSPLSTRLALLRKIARRDSGTPIWRDDIAAYEEVRHNQLQKESEAAFAAENLTALAALEQEVRSDAWLRQPADAVIERIAKSHGTARVKHSRKQLEMLVEKLTAAYSSFDVEGGRRLRTQWNAHALIAVDETDDPLLELVGPALDWLADEDHREEEAAAYSSTLQSVEDAVNEESPRHELSRQYAKLQLFDREISPVLVSRINERFQALDALALRRSRLITFGLLASMLLVGGVITWSIYAYTRAGVVAAHAASLRQLLDEEKTSEAKGYVRNLESSRPDIVASPEVQKLIGDLHVQERDEAGRKVRLSKLLTAARESGQTWEGLSLAIRSLNEADSIANAMEQAEVTSLRHDIESKHREFQREYDDDFAADLADYAKRHAEVDRGDLDALRDLEIEGEALAKRKRVSPELTEQVDPLLKRLVAWRLTETQSSLEARLIANINRNVGDLPTFRAAVTAYTERFPQKSLAQGLKQLVENEAKLWEGLEQWNALVGKWERQDLRKVEGPEAAALIAEAEALKNEHPGFPVAGNVARVCEFLTPVTKRVNEDQFIHLTLNQPLSTIRDLRVAIVKADGQYLRYYFSPARQVRVIGDQYYFNCYIEPGLNDTRSVRIGSGISNPKSSDGASYDWIAPQTRFSQVALDHLAEFDVNEWERGFCNLITKLDDSVQMAPQVKVQLLNLLLNIACRGSQPMHVEYGAHVQMLNATPINPRPNWIDPKDDGGVSTKNNAANLLRRLGFRTLEHPTPARNEMSPLETARRVARLLNEMKQPELGDRYAWIGWLRKDSQSKWTVAGRRASESANKDVYVVYPNQNNLPQIARIGTLTNGQLSPRSSSSPAMRQGRPVYAVAP